MLAEDLSAIRQRRRAIPYRGLVTELRGQSAWTRCGTKTQIEIAGMRILGITAELTVLQVHNLMAGLSLLPIDDHNRASALLIDQSRLKSGYHQPRPGQIDEIDRFSEALASSSCYRSVLLESSPHTGVASWSA